MFCRNLVHFLTVTEARDDLETSVRIPVFQNHKSALQLIQPEFIEFRFSHEFWFDDAKAEIREDHGMRSPQPDGCGEPERPDRLDGDVVNIFSILGSFVHEGETLGHDVWVLSLVTVGVDLLMQIKHFCETLPVGECRVEDVVGSFQRSVIEQFNNFILTVGAARFLLTLPEKVKNLMLR